MIKPLSCWKYYRNNQKRFYTVFMVTFLSIILQYSLLIYVTTLLNFFQGTSIAFWNSVTYIASIQPSQTNWERLQQKLIANPAVAQVLPFAYYETSINGVGSPQILFVESNRLQAVTHILNLKLIQGNLPAPGSSDVVLHWQIAANKGLKIGNRFGSQVSALELVPGKYRLSGLLDGKIIIGLSDLDRLCTYYHNTKTNYPLLIIPHKGRLSQVRKDLTKMINTDKTLITLTETDAANQTTVKTVVLLLNIVYLTITCIITLCVGFLFYLYFYQRRPEFGLLKALGHTRQRIIARAFYEIFGIIAFGFTLGVTVTLLGGWTLNRWLLLERGLPLILLDPGYPFKLLSTPLFVTFCSLTPVWRMLKTVDPILIIEGAK